MSGWKDLLLDIIKLTDSVKTLDAKTEKLSDRVLDIDKRVVRIETLVEIGQSQSPPGPVKIESKPSEG